MRMEENAKKCPICKKQLYKRYEGLVCKNWKCELYFKLGKGWIFLDKSKKDSKLFFTAKYDFDITRHKNLRRWLQLKSALLYEKQVCEICGSGYYLEIHHILPRSENPELAMDKQNLMVLCEDCHKKIHSNDKYAYFRIKEEEQVQ